MKQLKKQSGAVLITSLIMLVVLTLLGLSAMQDASMEERMAGNMRAQNMAFQSAESALRVGENQVEAGGVLSLLDPAQGTFDVAWWRTAAAAWWVSNGETAGVSSLAYKTDAAGDDVFIGASNSNLTPRYTIETYDESRWPCETPGDLALDCDHVPYYRITSRGVDESDRSEVILRSTFRGVIATP